jgi:hypothetical protein
MELKKLTCNLITKAAADIKQDILREIISIMHKLKFCYIIASIVNSE